MTSKEALETIGTACKIVPAIYLGVMSDLHTKLEVEFNTIEKDLLLLELIKQTCIITIREIQGTYYLFIGNSIKGAKPLTKEELEILNGE